MYIYLLYIHFPRISQGFSVILIYTHTGTHIYENVFYIYSLIVTPLTIKFGGGVDFVLLLLQM